MSEINASQIVCVCALCGVSSTDNVVVEFNFAEQSIHCLCPACKKINTLEIKTDKAKPYPRARLMR